MDDDWQTDVLTSRHMHNRVHNRPNRRNRPFDIHKTFGSYTCKCAAGQGKQNQRNSQQEITLELYRLSPNGAGIVGEFKFPGVLEAAVILAASRASLDSTVNEVEAEAIEDDDGNDERDESQGDDESDASDAEDPESERDSEDPARFRRFEKNSFRAPKFWLRWNGIVEGSEVVTTDMGYIVFSGADCRKFKGTITCGPLGWKDIAISGHKVAGRGASDVPVKWDKQIV
ncbi:uncharacterized protein N0V89_006952 [Didymosphaeria variabile]|uniref:Uncharacterized protein n=1 Tax=Didymosphaeria variabile TaxID=1932322 RepID=A0A9W9C915_9PLEO|nr:uncharacterized protein N0V89_006952 [Didymosphaeria variabile]KAJ4351609.1 hypothetical protein N0V89_006952 [Didymosphaeria variabile]